MMTERLPWEIVETLPTTDAATIAHWNERLSAAFDDHSRTRAKIGLALALYWAVQEGIENDFDEVAKRRRTLTAEAVASARRLGDPDLIAEALLGVLYADWTPSAVLTRSGLITELGQIRPGVIDEELRFRIDEWGVIDAFDHGRLDDVRERIAAFQVIAADTDLPLFRRRAELWRATIAMIVGEVDRAVAINQAANAGTSGAVGTPFAFQNAAITVAIERFLRRGLGDTVEALRSILASSPRVSVNWSIGLAFSLAESGAVTDARSVYDPIAADSFVAVPEDLNWLVTTQLLGLIALRIGDEARWPLLLERLRPFAALDGTHGSGYASYGPVGRTVGALAAATGHFDEATLHFDHVLETRAPGPWSSLTRLDRAEAFRSHDPDGAARDARIAAGELRSFGLDQWAEIASDLETDLAPLTGSGIVRAEGDRWVLRHADGEATVRDGVGMRLLIELLARPGEALDTAALTGAAPDSVAAADTSSIASSALDARARSAYQHRLRDLEAQSRRTRRDEDEIEFLRRELAGGRYARAVSAEQERARVRTSKALHRTIAGIAEQSPPLGHHLRTSIETGRSCIYAPASGQPWVVRRRSMERTDS